MAVAAKFSKKPLVSVEEVESDSSLGVEDDTEAEPGDDMDIDIKEEVRDSEGEDPLLLDSFIPDDSFPEIKEDEKDIEEDSDEEFLTSDDYGDDDDDDTGIKSEEWTDSENHDIKDSDSDSKKPKEKVKMASKPKSKKRVRIMAESSDDSESENSDNEADDAKGKERSDEEDIKTGLADVITKILASSGTKDKLLAKAKKDFMIKKEETGSEFEFVDVDGKTKKEVKIKVEDEEEPEDKQKLAHKKHIERQLSHRSDIVTLRDAGLSIRQIAARLGISRTTVCKWIRRNEETGCLSDLARKPRSRVTNKQEDEAIRRMLEENPFISAKAICENLQLNASAATVIRRLNAVGIHRVSTVKERLTRKQREERLSFARHFVGKDLLQFWSRVVFSNEKTFTSTDDDQMHAWRRNNTRYDCINICKESSSQGAFVNTWGWFSIHGMGDMIRIEGKLTPAKYVDILREFFLPSLRAQNHPFPDGPILFIQDQCHVHSERVVEEWFASQQDLELLLLPSIAYDLNPIENIWGNIVNAWKPHKDQTAAELMTSIKEQWELFRNKEQLIHSYVASMPTRLKNVIEKKGGWTIY